MGIVGTDRKNNNRRETEERQLYACFMQQIGETARGRMRVRENLRRELETLQIKTQSGAVGTSYLKAKIDNRSRWRVYGERDEAINHTIRECSWLAQRVYRTRHDWVEKMIHWELCRGLNFDRATKWCVYRLESIRANKKHRFL